MNNEFLTLGSLFDGSDSAQYKMWGNGMALPNALHVVKGIRNLVLDEMLS